MNTHIQSFQIGSQSIITFHQHEASGYVGESHYWTTAKEVNFLTGEIKELDYDQLKEVYNKHITGKSDRIKFYYMMRPMSPKAMGEEGLRSTAEAISIVK